MPTRRERLLHLVQMIPAVRAAVQVRRVRPGEGRRDDIVGHGREELIDLVGRLHSQRDRPVGRERLQKRQKYLVEQLAVVPAATLGARRSPAHEAEPLAVSERDVG